MIVCTRWHTRKARHGQSDHVAEAPRSSSCASMTASTRLSCPETRATRNLLGTCVTSRVGCAPCPCLRRCTACHDTRSPVVTGITINKHYGGSPSDYPIILVRVESDDNIPDDSNLNTMVNEASHTVQ